MSKFWTAVVSIVLVVCMVGLMFIPQAPQNSRGSVYVVVPGKTQQAETQRPEGNWLLVRRIARP